MDKKYYYICFIILAGLTAYLAGANDGWFRISQIIVTIIFSGFAIYWYENKDSDC